VLDGYLMLCSLGLGLRIILRHLQDQRAYGPCRARPSRGAVRVGPVPLDQIGVPPQQRTRGDNPLQLTELAGWQQPGQPAGRCPASSLGTTP